MCSSDLLTMHAYFNFPIGLRNSKTPFLKLNICSVRFHPLFFNSRLMLPWRIFFFVKQNDLEPWLYDFDEFDKSYESFMILFHHTVFYSIVLYCIVLCCIVLYCTILYYTVLYCTVQYCTWCSWNHYAVTIQPFLFSLLLSLNIFLFSCFPSTHVLDWLVWIK